MNELEQRIREAGANHRPALIPFLTAGFPDTSSFWPTLMELDENGADIIEIGIPFSDPVADGPVVEKASRQALSDGVNLRDTLVGLQERKGLFNAGIVLMGYLNPFLQYGFDNLAHDAAEGGVHGLIVPDLPFEESAPLREALKRKNIALIPLVGPNTDVERMKLYANSEGYVYVVSVMGVTGARETLPPEVVETVKRARSVFHLPLALGFGLREPSQLDAFPAAVRPDAVVFGSALLKHLEEGGTAAQFMARWH
ncbi:MAG: tryptophan synthase subunit alpha [Desulfovibrio sp.]|nr:tryptophan synthase subunit alpha [Desulfovibrio sp.]